MLLKTARCVTHNEQRMSYYLSLRLYPSSVSLKILKNLETEKKIKSVDRSEIARCTGSNRIGISPPPPLSEDEGTLIIRN
jgi:hypothetical protein